MKQFNIGDEIEIVGDEWTFLTHFTANSSFVRHGSRIMKENKGKIVGKWKDEFAVSYISDENKEVILDFLPKYLKLIESNSSMKDILGPQQRKEIYVWLLEAFKADKEYERMSGFCAALVIHTGVKGEIENYPELMAQKPSTEPIFGCYWWRVGKDTNGREKRIEALKKALKQVNKLL